MATEDLNIFEGSGVIKQEPTPTNNDIYWSLSLIHEWQDGLANQGVLNFVFQVFEELSSLRDGNMTLPIDHANYWIPCFYAARKMLCDLMLFYGPGSLKESPELIELVLKSKQGQEIIDFFSQDFVTESEVNHG